MNNSNRRWSDDDDATLQRLYKTQTHAEIAVLLGRSELAVRNRCSTLRLRKHPGALTQAEIERIREWYAARQGADLDLKTLAKELGRGRAVITHKASELGLTDPNRARPHAAKTLEEVNRRPRKPQPNDWTPNEEAFLRDWYASREGQPLNQAALAQQLGRSRAAIAHKAARLGLAGKPRQPWGDDVPHPKGFAGKTISPHTRKRLDEGMREFWANQPPEERSDRALRALKTRAKRGNLINPRHKTTWKQGWHTIGGKRHFFRSKWEVNYAHYLEWLKCKGQIVEWEYEPTTFWFEAIKRGTRSYTPDFRVTELDGSVAYHEVKGWMDARSKTKLKRMAKYHPDVTVLVVDADAYKALTRMAARLVPGWQ